MGLTPHRLMEESRRSAGPVLAHVFVAPWARFPRRAADSFSDEGGTLRDPLATMSSLRPEGDVSVRTDRNATAPPASGDVGSRANRSGSASRKTRPGLFGFGFRRAPRRPRRRLRHGAAGDSAQRTSADAAPMRSFWTCGSSDGSGWCRRRGNSEVRIPRGFCIPVVRPVQRR